jgi:hypothetical protein
MRSTRTSGQRVTERKWGRCARCARGGWRPGVARLQEEAWHASKRRDRERRPRQRVGAWEGEEKREAAAPTSTDAIELAADAIFFGGGAIASPDSVRLAPGCCDMMRVSDPETPTYSSLGGWGRQNPPRAGPQLFRAN